METDDLWKPMTSPVWPRGWMPSRSRCRRDRLGEPFGLKAQPGYEILRAAKRSMDVFWGVSNGQLYPQLRHLAEQGLIQPAGEAEGPRSRQRWEITDAGRSALRSWLESLSSTVQIRDENLVKLFFANATSPDLVGRLLEERRKIFSRFEKVIDAVLPGDRRPEAEQAASLGTPELLFRYGKHFTKSTMRWIDQEESRMLSALRKAGEDDEKST